jgi:hypothetical protein
VAAEEDELYWLLLPGRRVRGSLIPIAWAGSVLQPAWQCPVRTPRRDETRPTHLRDYLTFGLATSRGVAADGRGEDTAHRRVTLQSLATLLVRVDEHTRGPAW